VGQRILEREQELAALAAAAREAADGAGSVALVFGEAGIGKSVLVRSLRAHLPAEGRLLVGYCDDLRRHARSGRSVTWREWWAPS
jgi:predicted ATPase